MIFIKSVFQLPQANEEKFGSENFIEKFSKSFPAVHILFYVSLWTILYDKRSNGAKFSFAHSVHWPNTWWQVPPASQPANMKNARVFILLHIMFQAILNAMPLQIQLEIKMKCRNECAFNEAFSILHKYTKCKFEMNIFTVLLLWLSPLGFQSVWQFKYVLFVCS